MNTNYDHLMIDIETVDTANTAAMLSIAAVPWNPNTGRYDKKDYFYAVVDLQSCFNIGLTAGGSTLEWWFTQSLKARMNAIGYDENLVQVIPKIHIKEALSKLSKFIKSYPLDDKKFKVWGNGVRFDLGILDNAFKAAKMHLPWRFTNERDVRTLVSILPELRKGAKNIGTPHNAVDDCIYQIKYCSKIWKKIHGTANKKTKAAKTS